MGGKIPKDKKMQKHVECLLCGKKILMEERKSHKQTCRNKISKTYSDPLKSKHNTPNLHFLRSKHRKVPEITEEDLRGFEYLPEILESSTKNLQKEFEKLQVDIREFCEENKTIYNEVPLAKKYLALKVNLSKLKIDWRIGSCTISVSREGVLEESMQQLEKIDLYKELKINFYGELSSDAGGIIREWFTVIFREILSQDRKLFIRTDCDEFSYKINDKLEANSIVFSYFRFTGILIAKALLENVTVNTSFSIIIYKMILNENIHLEDLKYYDQSLFQSLTEIHRYTGDIQDLELYFYVQIERDGELINEELKEGGVDIKVDSINLKEYIQKRRIEHMENKIRPFINEIRHGLFSIIPEHHIYVFHSQELYTIINGKPEIEIKDWESNTKYKEPYNQDSKTIKWFWKILKSLTQEHLSKFLHFCTGSTRIPITGFSELESNRGTISKFCIEYAPYSPNQSNYIRAHTCFNRIDLPEYPSKGELKQYIDFIINNEILGFGIE